METQHILKLLHANAELIGDQLRITDKAIDEINRKRSQSFLCEKCNKWKKRRVTELTIDQNSDDGRDLGSAYCPNEDGQEI